MTQLSTTAKAVLNAVITNTGSASLSSGAPVGGIFYTSTASNTLPATSATFNMNVQTDFVGTVTTTNQFTTTGYVFPYNGTIWVGDPPYNDGGLYPNPLNPTPQTGWPNITIPPIPTKPDLDQLEEGEHDIPGGKIIIKKIKVTDKQVEEAMIEVLGPEASPEEKKKVLKEIEDYAASEEREV